MFIFRSHFSRWHPNSTVFTMIIATDQIWKHIQIIHGVLSRKGTVRVGFKHTVKPFHDRCFGFTVCHMMVNPLFLKVVLHFSAHKLSTFIRMEFLRFPSLLKNTFKCLFDSFFRTLEGVQVNFLVKFYMFPIPTQDARFCEIWRRTAYVSQTNKCHNKWYQNKHNRILCKQR